MISLFIIDHEMKKVTSNVIRQVIHIILKTTIIAHCIMREKITVIYSLTKSLQVTFAVLFLYDVIHANENSFSRAYKR
jgi:hypothetical protein